ncbi:hypothetical protein BV372_16910 [Nostoc sp. T09]|nr:hypothetical protein BV372_16910 [Nostoc sp. T09]
MDDNYQIFKIIDITNNEQSVLKTQIVRGGDVDKLFNREIQLLLNLDNPAVPRGKDSFSVMILNPERREIRCLVMEYIQGEDLERWITNNGKIGSDLSSREAKVKTLDWLYQLTNILSSIHKRNVIHRDIKPSNIMLRLNGGNGKELAIIDFGIAKRSIPAANQPTSTTLVGGSRGYTPPEIHKGQPVPKSDFFALGRTFVYLLTRKHPRDYGDNLQAWRKDTVFSDSGIIQLINDLMKERHEERPESTEIIQRIEKIRAKELQPITFFPPYYLWLREILTVIGAVVVLGLAFYGLFSLISGILDPTNTVRDVSASPNPSPTKSTSSPPLWSAQKLISAGEKPLYEESRPLSGDYAQLKDKGINAFKSDNYLNAEKFFTNLRKNAKQNKEFTALTDPEVLIFLNNAIARQQRKNGGPIHTIAVAIPITHRNQAGKDVWFHQGQQILMGVSQAQTKAIEQGINLEVVIANDRNLHGQAVSVAKELTQMNVQGRSILAVIGHYTSDVTCNALKEVYANAGIIVISPSSTKTDLRKTCGGGAFFRTASSTKIEAQALANYVSNLKESGEIREPKIAAFYNLKADFSKDLFKQFQLEIQPKGIKIPSESQIDLADDKFNADTALHKVSSANILVLFPDGATDTDTAYKNALKVLRESNVNTIKKILGSNPLLQLETITGQVKKLENKLVLATDWHWECGRERFRTDATGKWGGAVNRLTALSYEAVTVLHTALKNSSSESESVSRETLRKAVDNLSPVPSDVFDDNLGIKTISFDKETGDRKEISKRILVTPYSETQNTNVQDQNQQEKFQLLVNQKCYQ